MEVPRAKKDARPVALLLGRTEAGASAGFRSWFEGSEHECKEAFTAGSPGRRVGSFDEGREGMIGVAAVR